MKRRAVFCSCLISGLLLLCLGGCIDSMEARFPEDLFSHDCTPLRDTFLSNDIVLRDGEQYAVDPADDWVLQSYRSGKWVKVWNYTEDEITEGELCHSFTMQIYPSYPLEAGQYRLYNRTDGVASGSFSMGRLSDFMEDDLVPSCFEELPERAEVTLTAEPEQGFLRCTLSDGTGLAGEGTWALELQLGGKWYALPDHTPEPLTPWQDGPVLLRLRSLCDLLPSEGSYRLVRTYTLPGEETCHRAAAEFTLTKKNAIALPKDHYSGLRLTEDEIGPVLTNQAFRTVTLWGAPILTRNDDTEEWASFIAPDDWDQYPWSRLFVTERLPAAYRQGITLKRGETMHIELPELGEDVTRVVFLCQSGDGELFWMVCRPEN